MPINSIISDYDITSLYQSTELRKEDRDVKPGIVPVRTIPVRTIPVRRIPVRVVPMRKKQTRNESNPVLDTYFGIESKIEDLYSTIYLN